MHDQSIAIVGLAGRFPGAPDASAFWRNLEQGVESLDSFSDSELAGAGIGAELLNDPNYVKRGMVLEGVDLFDAEFFGLNPREAEILDPQHRLFLECCWEAMEDAGYGGEAGRRSVGVFGGASINTYFMSVLAHNPAAVEEAGPYQLMIANDKDFLATRVSYKLNLKGPSVTVQTACSTSLVAVQLACQSLLARQCDMALAGGVSLHFPQKTGHLYVPGMIFSPDGHCRPFDVRAAGIRAGAGAGVVALKRFDEALRDGDSIRAVILGAAVNNDGSAKMGYTAPSVEGQADAITAALEAGAVDAGSVSYVEAHGTATPIGDPIEIAALQRAFRRFTDRKGFCAIGSVKSNIGHLDTAAGVAGLIKTVLALEHKRIPASLNFTEPNPQIDFANSPFFVNSRSREWDSPGRPRRAGVSSFGIGGSNSHVVLEEAPAPEPSAVQWPAGLLTLSARSAAALEAASAKLAEHLAATPGVSLANACYTTQAGRKRFAHRRVAICSSRDEAIAALSSLDRRMTFAKFDEATGRSVTFAFSGQGSQHLGMAGGLYRFQPVFRRTLDFCADALKPKIGHDLRDLLYSPSASAALLNETSLAQPALFAVEYALAQMWISWGVHPDSAIGHSIGEYVAACLAGVFSLEDALHLVAARGRIMQQMPRGAMLAVHLSEGELRELLGERLSLAAINTPSLCTVSGTEAEIEALHASLEASGIESRPLHISHAFHSSSMDGAMELFLEHIQGVQLREPSLPFVSNLTGLPILSREATDPHYWAKHLRYPVRFADGIQALRSSVRVFLEVGPGQMLTTFALDMLRGSDGEAFASLPHVKDPQPAPVFILKTLGRLWMSGVDVNWEGVHAGERLHRVSLPTYPFERQRYWGGPSSAPKAKTEPALSRKEDLADWFCAPSFTRSVMPSAVARDCIAPWIIFEDAGNFGSATAQALTTRQEPFVTVKKGDGFASLGWRHYAVNPTRAGDYLHLLNAVANEGMNPRGVLYLWGLDGARAGFDGLLRLAQAFGDRGPRGPVDCIVVSAAMLSVTGRENMEPEQALLSGPCKVIPREYPQIRCRGVDICREEWSPALANELLLEPEMPWSSLPAAYRSGWRWQQSFEPIRLPAKTSSIRDRGVYLITGGLGGIALTLSTQFARDHQARVALISRSSLPERPQWRGWLNSHDEADEISRKIRSLQRIEELGGEALVLSADVCDRTHMQNALDVIHRRFGPVHGAVHAAGVAGAGIIQLKTMEAAAKVLAPKVDGALILDSLLRDEPLDFFVLCSSINALCGVAGAVDYTSANAFLDAFAASRYGKTQTLVASIDWDAWQEVGMAVNAQRLLPDRRERDLQTGIKPSEGVEAFHRVLGVRLAQVAVITRDLPRMLQMADEASNGVSDAPKSESSVQERKPAEQYARPQAAGAYVPPQTVTERKIAEVWKDQLGIEEIGIDDNFFELGGHSLLATALLARVGQAFGLTIGLRVIFEEPTVRALSEHVDNLLWASPQVSSPDTASEEREEVDL